MKKFAIITDSCSDLERPLREKYDIDYVPMRVILDGKDMPANLDWEMMPVKEFYDNMRRGKRFYTAQIIASVYREAFERHIKAGCDVLYIACSSALSVSVETSRDVAKELMDEYPGAKVVCIDSLNACFSLGMLCLSASELRAEGKTIEETAEWVTAHRKLVNQECTVDKLTYLKQAGRVSAASAFFGGILSVKPIIISDVRGLNTAIEKVKGRANSMNRLIERFKEEYRDCEHQRVRVVHADCPEDAEELRKRIQAELDGKGITVDVGYIGPIVGATTGPGTLAIYFYGKEVTFDHLAK